MNTSFELLSSMSPKVNNSFKPVKKGPSILALRKYFRKSLCLEQVASANESILTISSTCSSSSQSEKVLNDTPIEISDDSEVVFASHRTSFEKSDQCQSNDVKMSKGKYKRVQHWVDNVNKETSLDSSSLLDVEDYMEGSSKNNNSARNEGVELNCDFFKLTLDESISKKIHNTQSKNLQFECDDQEELSNFTKSKDSPFNNRKAIISPSSESRITIRKKIPRELPKTDRPVKKKEAYTSGSSLLKTLQKARFKKAIESPWVESLKRICDSDTDSETEDVKHVLEPVRLNFEDCANNGSTSSNTATKISSKSQLENSNKNSSSETYSFLASLSSDVHKDNCDPSALIFRDNFQQHRETLTVKLFKLYNRQIFENLLPKNTTIEWNDRLRETAGKCVCKKITRSNGEKYRIADIILSRKILDSADRLRDTLIHELCHAATWIVSEVCDGHGYFWKAWASRAMKTFPELPPIERCHDYVVKTKYTYKCKKCGHTIGRHTKSFNTESRVCSRCTGKFEVFINKTTKTGETKSVPCTPKKTNQFALFIKENYANYKTPDSDHGDVMKMLGKAFSELKVQNKDKS